MFFKQKNKLDWAITSPEMNFLHLKYRYPYFTRVENEQGVLCSRRSTVGIGEDGREDTCCQPGEAVAGVLQAEQERTQ